MKTLIATLLVFSFSLQSFAAESVKASENPADQILDLVQEVHYKYSGASELQAKVLEILAGDGVNARRMILSLNDGYGEGAKIYELSEMMGYVRRITFLAKNVLVINYTQDSLEEDGDDYVMVSIKKSMKITISKNAKGQLTDSIQIEDISRK